MKTKGKVSVDGDIISEECLIDIKHQLETKKIPVTFEGKIIGTVLNREELKQKLHEVLAQIKKYTPEETKKTEQLIKQMKETMTKEEFSKWLFEQVGLGDKK